MIDWGDVPKGSTASIYWPAVAAADVIALAKTWGGAAGLASSDAHTLTLQVDGGVSYLPIPKGTTQNFAGLFTLELPPGIKTGQQFEVLVRRVSTQPGKRPSPPPPPLHAAPSLKPAKPAPAAELQPTIVIRRPPVWRYVVGSFVVRIPVSTGAKMLITEQLTLASMKWRLAHLSPGNRWAPVLERYIKYLSARLDGIGGDSSQVPASLTWTPPLHGGGQEHPPHKPDLCGKVAEVLFDCHGEFDGFVLDECCRQRVVRSRERGVADLVLLACRENLTLCVTFCPTTNRIQDLAIGA